MRIQAKRSRENIIRLDGIEEDENERWADTEVKLKIFLYNEFEIVDNLYIERAHQVTRKGGISDNKQ